MFDLEGGGQPSLFWEVKKKGSRNWNSSLWSAQQAGNMNKIVHHDWLAEQARWQKRKHFFHLIITDYHPAGEHQELRHLHFLELCG